ncbi:hypothetical protein [Flavobacterium sp. PL002]|uniref:hypothetical protein n=1 Tax=Flavobacterium sp. PL002 TaxID=1897058 RepID=UPI0017885966|nr:hypothetical protein [Flavobacterium sp. PL002]MBE0391829.1 hypothetical protein [Flavobacterium sp. PL002]
MKNKITLSILLLNMICVFAQEKEFIVKENIEDVISKVSSFQSAITNDVMISSSSEKIFETEITVKEEEYNSDTSDNYLKSKLITPVLITSNWNLVLEKISINETKVSITLAQALSKNKVLKKDQITSNGKIEKDLKEYINDEANKVEKSPTEDIVNEEAEGKVTQMANAIHMFEKSNYAVQYPKDWTMQSPGPFNEPFCLFGPKEEEYVYINLIKEENSKPKSGELLQAYMERNLYNIVSKRVLITKKELVNATTYKIEYEEEIDEVLKSIRYIYKVKDDIYLLTYCSTATYFNAYSKQAEAIMKTLKIDGILKNIK